MRKELVLLPVLLVLILAAPAFAAHESGPIGPYNVSFDMNTTSNYTVIVEAPTSGITSQGENFTRYNLTVDSTDYFLWLILTRYEEPMLANITANAYIVWNALLNAGADQPKLYQPLIDGQPGVLGNFRFENQDLGQGQIQTGRSHRRGQLLTGWKSLRGWCLSGKNRLPRSYPPSHGRLSGTCSIPCTWKSQKMKARPSTSLNFSFAEKEAISPGPGIDIRDPRAEKGPAKSFKNSGIRLDLFAGLRAMPNDVDCMISCS